jgi:hypothetical protein
MSMRKARLDASAQALLLKWIAAALKDKGNRKSGDFCEIFGVTSFAQTTFSRCHGPSGRFTEEDAEEICRVIGCAFDDLTGAAASEAGPGTGAARAACTHHCSLFHAHNAATCSDPTQAAARKLATLKVVGNYKVVYRYVDGEEGVYEVEFKPCACGATLFQYVDDPDPLPLSNHGFALRVDDMLSIYMIGGGLHWTLVCHVPRQLKNTVMTGILLDPNATRAQVEANKFVMVKLGTPIDARMTPEMISSLLDNKPGTATGALVAARQ